ncbi:type III secretion system needle filament subunit SctF [Pantoea sp. SORGH_AS_0659]|uniref:type III secretion system needle filament subunit SctF n=1 Tax=Pantoea sp. SORGH_AS_0659 TaxID=3062597 RepID=UPI0028624A7C|nr:type III secretion system needle filament subunit SctF [Pantoea sp. SORGH_AS_0659]MDR6352508.1 type III secretion protein F [Pantoea sp. SORGH_AS_0659]
MNEPRSINGWDGFLTHQSNQFTEGVEELNKKLEEALVLLTADPGSPEKLAQYQSLMSEYTLYRNAQSNVTKAYKDVASSIISNFR